MQDDAGLVPTGVGRISSHGAGALADPQLFWLHVASDLLIGLAYVAISVTLIYLVWKGRREFPFQRMFIAFGLFIIACGATHFVGIYNLWAPNAWFSLSVNLVTAMASVGTAVLLPPLVPRILQTLREARLSEERRVQAESAGRLRKMAEAMPQIVWSAGADGSVDYFNPRWFDFTGIAPDQDVDSDWSQVLHPDDAARTVAAWQRSVSTGEPYEVTHRVRRRDGEYRWLLSRAVAARDARGTITGWFGSTTDVDEQKRSEADLRLAKEEAEAANRAKSDFLSTMSHELRTPLNAIGGYVELIGMGLHGPVTQAQTEALSRVRRNQAHLLTLINDILNYARIEAGRIEIRSERVPLAELVCRTVGLLEPQIASAGLGCAHEGDSTAHAIGDEDRIGQILLNLLANAIKYTPPGGRIEILSEAEGDRVHTRVRDTGRGVPPEMTEKIFDPFVQVRNVEHRDSSRQGVGLGLAISRDLARAMGGDVSVESVLGAGSTFTLTLPRCPEAATLEAVPLYLGERVPS
jgi:PAS domain S-box-containing protein